MDVKRINRFAKGKVLIYIHRCERTLEWPLFPTGNRETVPLLSTEHTTSNCFGVDGLWTKLNHQTNFVEPVTGANIQTVESLRSALKILMRMHDKRKKCWWRSINQRAAVFLSLLITLVECLDEGCTDEFAMLIVSYYLEGLRVLCVDHHPNTTVNKQCVL